MNGLYRKYDADCALALEIQIPEAALIQEEARVRVHLQDLEVEDSN